MQEAHQQLTQFSQGKRHFEKVRYRMGELIKANRDRYIRDGTVNLSKAYADACKQAGRGDNRASVLPMFSPRSRSPAVLPIHPCAAAAA